MPTSANDDIIQAHWLANELIGLNSLVYKSGEVTLLNIYMVPSEEGKKQYAFPIADTTVNSLEQYNEDVWTEIQAHPNFLIVGDLQIHCGEGGMGNEGFVAASDATGLAWALFSTQSNPFTKMTLNGHVLSAYSDLYEYRINLNILLDIKIVSLAD